MTITEQEFEAHLKESEDAQIAILQKHVADIIDGVVHDIGRIGEVDIQSLSSWCKVPLPGIGEGVVLMLIQKAINKLLLDWGWQLVNEPWVRVVDGEHGKITIKNRYYFTNPKSGVSHENLH